MRLLLTSALLGLAWFAAVNIAASAIAWILARAALLRTESRASTLLAIRLLPFVASVVFVAGVFLPAHWRFEQPNRTESFGTVLTICAAIAVGLLAIGVWRACTVSWHGYRLGKMMRRSAIELGHDTYEVSGLPGISLAGILRPQVIVGSEARAALTPAELDVAIAHELAHRRSHDNLKRFVLFSVPDVFAWFRTARQLEERWQAETECLADDHSVMGSDHRALTLASALVKVARLAGRDRHVLPSPAWSAFHVPTLLELRVRRLVTGNIPAPTGRVHFLAGSIAIALALSTAAWLFGVSYPLHVATEALVTHLP
jgi:hypothetical protein